MREDTWLGRNPDAHLPPLHRSRRRISCSPIDSSPAAGHPWLAPNLHAIELYRLKQSPVERSTKPRHVGSIKRGSAAPSSRRNASWAGLSQRHSMLPPTRRRPYILPAQRRGSARSRSSRHMPPPAGPESHPHPDFSNYDSGRPKQTYQPTVAYPDPARQTVASENQIGQAPPLPALCSRASQRVKGKPSAGEWLSDAD